MKKVIVSILCVAVLAALYACSNPGNKDMDVETGSLEVGQGITVNDIPFERVKADELPADIMDDVDQGRAEEGFEILQSGETNYLVVYAGERPTGGYSVEIKSIVDLEGVTQVTVSEKAPGEGIMVTQAITYPIDIARLELGISGNVELNFIKQENG